MAESKALRSGVGYTLGNVLIKGINFLTLPIFSRLLSPEEFGIYNVFASYDMILFVVIGLALHTSIQSANLEFRGKINSYTSSISLIYILNGLVALAVVLLFRRQLGGLLALPPAALILLVLDSFATAVIQLYNTRTSLDYSYKKYLLVSACSSFLNIALSLVLILTVCSHDRAMGRIIGATVPPFLVSLALLFDIFRKEKPRSSKTYWKFGVIYSLPIVPHGISQMLLNQCDRIMIRSMVSDAAAGIYSLAGNIKLVLVIITESVTTAWTTWFYSQIDKGETKAIQKRATQLLGLFFILTTGLMALSPELVWLLGGAEYTLGKYVAIPLILDAFALFLYNLVVPAQYYAKKTTYIMYGTIAAAVVNIILNYIFIKLYGFIAAAYTTLASYLLFAAVHYFISGKLLKFFVVPPSRMIAVCAAVGVMAAWNLLFVNSILLRWGICAVAVIPTALLLLRQLREEKASAQEYANFQK